MSETTKIVFYFKTLEQFAFAASAAPRWAGLLSCSYFGKYIIAYDLEAALNFLKFLHECASNATLKDSFNLHGLRIHDQSICTL